MKNEPTKEQLAKIPQLYKTEHLSTKDKIIQLHFSFLKCDWYIVEFDGQDTFFGFAILNDDLEMAEWGYISFEFLKGVDIKGFQVENDSDWEPKRAVEVGRICEACRWDVL